MNGTNPSLEQKQNNFINREPFYRKLGLISFTCGFLVLLGAGISFSKGDELLSFGLLLLSLFGFALATDAHFKIFDIESIKRKATDHK